MCALARVFVRLVLVRVRRRMDVPKRTAPAGSGGVGGEPETCGFSSEKAWLEINRRVQFAPPHLHPAGRQVSATRGRERDAVVSPKSHNPPFSLGGCS